MTRADAAERFTDAEPELGTREVRNLPEPGEVRRNTRPPTATWPGTALYGSHFSAIFASSAIEHPQALSSLPRDRHAFKRRL